MSGGALPAMAVRAIAAFYSGGTMLIVERQNAVETAPAGPLLTKKQIAQKLGVCRRTVDNLIATRRIPVIRLSRRLLRLDLTQVLQALNKFEVRSISNPTRGGGK